MSVVALVEVGWRRRRSGNIRGRRGGELREVMDGSMLERGGERSSGKCNKGLMDSLKLTKEIVKQSLGDGGS